MVGLIGKKIGMTQVFDEQGKLTPVTVILCEPNVVVAQRTPEKEGYSALLVGAEVVRPKVLTKPVLGQFPEGVDPLRVMVEFRDFAKKAKVGESFGLEVLEGLRYVDVYGISKGKGFQGVMKRHNFGGGPASHGSKFHRVGASTGNRTTPGRTFKNIKMPGRMGGDRVTVQNLRVVSIDPERKIILVKGAVPGSKNSFVVVRDAKKMK